MDRLQQYKKEIDAFLDDFLASKQKAFVQVNAFGPDVLGKIQGVISEGKTIRGSLVLLVHDLLRGKTKKEALRVAAAYELIQTGLVVHDDIMDHDAMRRGKPAMHVQYKSEALAMCVGDICFFLAQELLSDTPVAALSAQMFQEVGIAQMQDIAKTAESKKDIISLYTYKTARYSFSLPMISGALLAHADTSIIHTLEKLGENMGIVFQIQNDTLNELGDTREDKKTLARYHTVEPDLKKYHDKSIRLLHTLRQHMDTSPLEALLAFVIAHKR